MSIAHYPKEFLNQMEKQLQNEYELFLSTVSKPYYRGIRLNPKKKLFLNFSLLSSDILKPIPWSPDSYYLSNDSTIGSNPLHDAGVFYIQEPSAMIPATVLNPQPGETVLDLCAAPGGKSTQLALLMKDKGLIACNEIVPSRAKILSRNIERMGISNSLVVSENPQKLALAWPSLFDAILVDAPCSGEGMFRRHPETITQWNCDSPKACKNRQLAILNSAIAMLKPNGRLCYSTCTYNTTENEEVVKQILLDHPNLNFEDFSIKTSESEETKSINGCMHIYPHKIESEGHFVALFRKVSNFTNNNSSILSPVTTLLPNADKDTLSNFNDFIAPFDATNNFENFAMFGNSLITCGNIPPIKNINVLRAGLSLGYMKGKIFAPNHALALALDLPIKNTLPLDLQQAILYQQGNTLSYPTDTKGYHIVTYNNIPLGFVKVSNEQLKNHYPKGLRKN